jgi:predicted secreted Zn-dependent protease
MLAGDSLCRKIKAIAPCVRTVEEIKKRWDDMQGRTKKKANFDRKEDAKTGNLPIQRR